MTERSVLVRLKADISAFQAKMVAAGRTAETAFLASTKAADKNRAALRSVGNAAGIMGGAAALGVGAAIKSAADFDKAMSSVQAATHESTRNMGLLRQAAMKAGADTQYSATEAAGGIESLAKAGVSTSDILSGGLRGALSLAAAGTIDVQDAAEDAATAMTQFGLRGQDVPHVADLLAAAAGKAQGEVGDFSQALDQAGLVANQTGLSIEETLGSLAAFASKGLLGSDAGTSFKTFLQNLTPSSEKASKLMKQLGIEAYDAQGNFVGLTKYAGILRNGLSDLSVEQRNAALKTIFGSDSVRAATVLYDEGARGIANWTRKVNDQGYAAETAATKMDNLAGDLEQLKGSLETALIGTGEGAQGPLRKLTQNATEAVNAFNKLPQPVKNATFELGALVAVTGGAAWLGSRFIGAIAEGREALKTLGWTAKTTKTALAGIGKGIEFALVLEGINKIDDAMDAIFHERLDQTGLQRDLETLGKTGKMTGNLLETFGGNLGGVANDLGKLEGGLVSTKYGFQGLTDAIVGWMPGTTGFEATENRISNLDKALAQLVRGGNAQMARQVFNQIAAAAKKQDMSIDEVLKHLPGYARAIGDVDDKTKDAGKTTDWFSDVVVDDTRSVQGETRAVLDNARAHDKRRKELLASIDKNIAWEQSVDDAAKEARQGSKTLNLNTQAGRDNVQALADMAAAWNDLPDKTQRAQGGIKAARQEFIRIAEQMGADKKRAQELARELLDIPNPRREVSVDTGQASRDVDAFVSTMGRKLADIDDETVNVQLSGLAKLALSGQGPLRGMGPGMAFGGPVPGYLGTQGRDSVPIMAMPDEHMVTTQEVRAAGKGDVHRGHHIWEGIRHAALVGALPDPMDLPAYATGGAVVDPRVSQSGFPTAIRSIEAAFDHVVEGIGERLSDKINKMYQFGGGAPLGPGGTLSQGQIFMGQRFAAAQAGKPYIWGGVGPAGYDCSGYQSAILNAAMGRNPYQRIGSTSSMPWPGMAGGVGRYTIGWFTGDPGHTSGNIGGLNVESTGDHVRNGSAARSPLDSMFNHVGHYDTGGPLYPGWTAAYNGTGGTEYVVRGYADGGKVTKADRRANALEAALKQFDITPKMSRSDVRSEINEFRSAIREAFGKNSDLLDAFGKLDDRMLKVAKGHDKLVRSQEKLNESLKAIKDKRDQYAQSVAGNFRNDIFGGGLDDLGLQLNADTNDAQRMRRALKEAAKKGLSGGLYSGLAASGNFLLAAQFADLSRKQIRHYEHLYAGRQGASGALGRTAGAEVYGDRIHENSKALHRTNQHLAHNTRATRKLTRTLEKKERVGAGAHRRARGG